MTNLARLLLLLVLPLPVKHGQDYSGRKLFIKQFIPYLLGNEPLSISESNLAAVAFFHKSRVRDYTSDKCEYYTLPTNRISIDTLATDLAA